MKKEVTNFINSNAEISRHNITNKLWNLRNTNASLILFGFSACYETLACVSTFFANVESSHSEIKIENLKIKMQPECLTELEKNLIEKNHTIISSSSKVLFYA